MIVSLSIRYLVVRTRALRLAAATLVVFVGLTAGNARAQGTGGQTTPGGVTLTSADGTTSVQFGLTAQIDGRFALGDDEELLDDSFDVRRLRPSLRGRAGDLFDFVVSADFGRGVVGLQDAYVDVAMSDTSALRVGRAKVPLGYERMLSVQTMPFMERSFTAAIAPSRDIGIQVVGTLLEKQLDYSLGVFNGAADGSLPPVHADTGDGKDIVGRVVARPAAGLTLALAASAGDHTGTASLPEYQTSVFESPFFRYADDARIEGRLVRYTPAVAYYSGQFGGLAEYVTSRTTVVRGDSRASTWHEAWQVAGTWVLTGEDAAEDGVTPAVDFGAGGRGAIVLAARVHRLQVDRDAFVSGLAADGSNGRATAWSAGATWVLNRRAALRAMLERTMFDQSTSPRPSETSVAIRAQFSL